MFAFDSTHGTILFHKLDCIGVCVTDLNWFKIYLSNRTQVVSSNSNNNEKKPLNVDYGIVQGSTLGSLLFLVYIKKM